MIEIDQRWKLSELLTEDGAGVIELWMNGLSDEVRAQLEVRLINWASSDRLLETYASVVELDTAGERFQPLHKLRVIELLFGRVVYRIFGTDFDPREFVMLFGEIDPLRRGKFSAETMKHAKDRLDFFRKNPGSRREYEI